MVKWNRNNWPHSKLTFFSVKFKNLKAYSASYTNFD